MMVLSTYWNRIKVAKRKWNPYLSADQQVLLHETLADLKYLHRYDPDPGKGYEAVSTVCRLLALTFMDPSEAFFEDVIQDAATKIICDYQKLGSDNKMSWWVYCSMVLRKQLEIHVWEPTKLKAYAALLYDSTQRYVGDDPGYYRFLPRKLAAVTMSGRLFELPYELDPLDFTPKDYRVYKRYLWREIEKAFQARDLNWFVKAYKGLHRRRVECLKQWAKGLSQHKR